MVAGLVTSGPQTDLSAADFPASVCVIGVSTRAQLNTKSWWTGFAQFFCSWLLTSQHTISHIPYGVERCLEENQVSAEMFPTGMDMRCQGEAPLAPPGL